MGYRNHWQVSATDSHIIWFLVVYFIVPGGCGFLGRDGTAEAAAPAAVGVVRAAGRAGTVDDVTAVGVFRPTFVGVIDDGFGSFVPNGDGTADARADVGVVNVRVCAVDVWYVTVVVLRPPADRVSVRTDDRSSALGDCGGTSLDSEMSELTDARLLGRLLPWLGQGLVASSSRPEALRGRPRPI